MFYGIRVSGKVKWQDATSACESIETNEPEVVAEMPDDLAEPVDVAVTAAQQQRHLRTTTDAATILQLLLPLQLHE